MAIKIHEYPLTATTLQNEDFLDLDAFNSGTGQFQSKKISGADLKNSILGKWNYSDYALNFSQAGGVIWNGISVQSFTLVSLLSRWTLAAAQTGQARGGFINTILPNSYQSGNDLRITIKLTSGSGGDAFIGVGLVSLNLLGGYGGEPETTWITGAYNLLNAFNNDEIQLVFSGANLQSLQPISILFYRQSQNALDTINEPIYFNQILIEEV
jgi:hypothetical protein